MPATHSLQRQALLKAWTDPGAFATSLLLLFIDEYGDDKEENGRQRCLEWDGETILLSLEQDLGVELPQANYDRLMAAIGIVTTDLFYKSLPDFIAWCNILSGSPFHPGVWDPADAAEIAWGLSEAVLLWPPDEEDPFTPEILGYIGAMLDREGIVQPPDVLRIAVRDRDHLAAVSSYDQDPELFAAIWQFERSKTDDINAFVRAQMSALQEQLEQLPLRFGQASGVLRRALGAA